MKGQMAEVTQGKEGCRAKGTSAGESRPVWQWLLGSPEQRGSLLGRALVAGLIWEIFLENPSLRMDSGRNRQYLKSQVKKTLACHLAGRIPLASFQSLAHDLDHWFEALYPLMAHGPLTPAADPPISPCGSWHKGFFRADLFQETVSQTPGLLPQRRHRKVDPERLQQFLQETRGEWFRLREFERYFQMERKTAWEYVKKLLQAGVLIHNQGHSSAVRYRLAPRFLQPQVPPREGSWSPGGNH